MIDRVDADLREKEEREQERSDELEIERDWFFMKIEEAVINSSLEDEERLELFLDALNLPYGDKVLEAFKRIKFDYYAKVGSYQDTLRKIEEYWK